MTTQIEAKVKDPVCGMNVSPAAAKFTAHHGGIDWYFCGKSCLAKFEANPAAYDGSQPIQPKPAPPAAATYTCPMHPEIVRPAPGDCPICGMALEPVTPTADTSNPELDSMTRRLWIASALALPLLGIMFAGLIPGQPLARILHGATLGWVELALATPVVLWAGLPFFQRGWASVLSRNLNMFTLIAIGSGSAYLYSLIAVLAPALFPASFRGMSGELNLYFEASAVIIVLVLLGQVLELRARSQTGAAIRALLDLAPKTARRISPDGSEQEVALADIHLGDRLRVRPGEQVPTDGTVLEGQSTLDESMLTGEATPVAVATESKVVGGTVNGAGSFVMSAERVGADTLLAQIVRMVGEAQRTCAPIQRLADKVAAWFVPAVLAVAVITFIVWASVGPAPRIPHAFVNAVAVLIIACPCALGLATPMAVMVGAGRGAREGILIRNAEALETLEKVDTLVIDKTGTLTEGKPRVTSILPAAGFDENRLLQAAASLENSSEHPLAAAILAEARSRSLALLPVTGFRSIPGKGITGKVQSSAVAVGNEALMGELGVAGADLAGQAEALRSEGRTVMLVTCDGRLAGLLAVADPIKPSAAAAIAGLKAAGLKIVMLTGDNASTAASVARTLGIDFQAGMLPADKAAAIRALQAKGATVAMAGDGVNDAPALAVANVGIAMGTGADVAITSAGVTLLHGDLSGIARARSLSRHTMRNIRQNLFFAFVYNTLGVPLAAGILYPIFGWLLSPMIAAAAMSLSSVSVIANALRLRTQKL